MNTCRGSGYGMWQPGRSGGGMAKRRKHACPECGREVSVNVTGRLRQHADLRQDREEAKK